LKSLDERGAEPSTIHSTRQSIRLLLSKISISVRTADAFSSKIQKIRDDELYPQLVELIQRYRNATLICSVYNVSKEQNCLIHIVVCSQVQVQRTVDRYFGMP
jgi:hypothetical protein